MSSSALAVVNTMQLAEDVVPRQAAKVSASMTRILVAQARPNQAALLSQNLRMEGFTVRTVSDGREALATFRWWAPDLVLLDLRLPQLNGFEVLRGIRALSRDVAVLVYSELGEEDDRIRCFRLDADQFVTKPCSLIELLERIHSLLRRTTRSTSSDASLFSFGDVTVDPASRTVARDRIPVSLSPKAFDLLMSLVRRNGRVASRVELLREVWGYGPLVLSRTVDSHIVELRRKLEHDPTNPRHLITVFKLGYRFAR
jgi:DNA-binding response OmpR family regulator